MPPQYWYAENPGASSKGRKDRRLFGFHWTGLYLLFPPTAPLMQVIMSGREMHDTYILQITSRIDPRIRVNCVPMGARHICTNDFT